MNLSQTDKIFGALLIGFVIFITVKGELPNYILLLTSPYKAPPAPAVDTGGSSSGAGGFLSGIGSLFGFGGGGGGGSGTADVASAVSKIGEALIF